MRYSINMSAPCIDIHSHFFPKHAPNFAQKFGEGTGPWVTLQDHGDGTGMMMLGDKNTLYAPGGRPDSPRLVGTKAMDELKQNRPAPTIPRVVAMRVRAAGASRTDRCPSATAARSAMESELPSRRRGAVTACGWRGTSRGC